MKKYKRILLLCLCLPLLFSCSRGGAETTAPEDTAGSSVHMIARVTAVGELIEVEVIEGEYGASGPYWIVTGESTKYFGRNGKAIGRDAIAVGDTIEILYGGQVMMSYPPKIAASRITVK